MTALRVQVNDLKGTGTVPIIGPNTVATPSITVTVNDGGDDSGVSVEINPATLDVEAANGSVEILTFSYNVTTAGAFTLSINQSTVELAGRDDPLDVTLSFSDGRGSTIDRTITIRIVSDEIPPTLPEDKVITLVIYR